MSESSIRGSCLCGQVAYEADPPFGKMVHCHCSRCRKATGTGHATNLMADPRRFRWLSGEELIARYELPGAQSFSRWFCSRCGSPVPRLPGHGKVVVVPAGSLDTASPIAPTDHIFWASRVSWGCVSGGLPTHEEYPPSW